MYYSIYTSDDHYEIQGDQDEFIEDNTNKLCLICWSPSKQNDPIKHMKDFSYIFSLCKCNMLIHSKCLHQWIKHTASCPICRKTVMVHVEYNSDKYIRLLSYYVFVFNCTNSFVRFTTILSLFNLFTLCLYNLYLMYYIKIYIINQFNYNFGFGYEYNYY